MLRACAGGEDANGAREVGVSEREEWLAIEKRGWGRFLARALVLGVVVFGAVRLAVARDGVPGGAARSFVTVAGTLTGVSTPTVAMTFTFHRAAGAVMCVSRVESVGVGAGGAFSTPVPIDAPGCPATLFDGSDVQVDVAVGSEVVARNAAINPVPYAHYASQYGTPDCPVGYERVFDQSGGFSESDDTRLCVRRNAERSAIVDEVVRVGDGSTAFWVDRYEATVWTTRNGDGTPLGTTSPDYPDGFPSNGQWGRPPSRAPSTRLFALSRAGTWRPSVYLTWFQAQGACRISGKRLPTGEEWLAAANGTDDLLGTTSDGADGRCVLVGGVAAVITRPRCRSRWGAHDMIGNVAEWTADWMASVGRGSAYTTPGAINGNEAANGAAAWPDAGRQAAGWPDSPSYGGDRVFSVNSAAYTIPGNVDFRFGVPSAVLRGGTARDATGAGVFYVNYAVAPSYEDDATGFRCVIPR